MPRLKLWGWLAVAVVISGLSIPWFLWRDSTVVAGVPLWLWWHIGWMVFTSVVCWLFTQHAWGLGIESTGDRDSSDEPPKHARNVGTGGETP